MKTSGAVHRVGKAPGEPTALHSDEPSMRASPKSEILHTPIKSTKM